MAVPKVKLESLNTPTDASKPMNTTLKKIPFIMKKVNHPVK